MYYSFTSYKIHFIKLEIVKFDENINSMKIEEWSPILVIAFILTMAP